MEAPASLLFLLYFLIADRTITITLVAFRLSGGTSMHKMRSKYRSAIYVHEPPTAIAVRAAIEQLGHETGSAFVTEVLPFRAFRESDPRFRDYYLRNRAGPFCESYIRQSTAAPAVCQVAGGGRRRQGRCLNDGESGITRADPTWAARRPWFERIGSVWHGVRDRFVGQAAGKTPPPRSPSLIGIVSRTRPFIA